MTINPNLPTPDDTIVALASAPGRAGIAVIRLSGKQSADILQALTRHLAKPRVASLRTFYDADNSLLDKGLVLWFPNPHSFTGEDVAELHVHGSPITVDLIIKRCMELGARTAKPGEFSERAFLNQKLDLAQAEAIADLINSASTQAAKSALRSLQGEFSRTINTLAQQLLHLRMYVEAAIDFPEEEVDFLSDGYIAHALNDIETQLLTILSQAKQGALLREGITIALAGLPNAGKSSLLNQLSGQDTAIVTHIPGTTRDLLREHIQLEGIPLTIVDTAGIRDSEDVVEQEGIRRAKQAIHHADLCLLLVDGEHQSERQVTDLLASLDLPKTIKDKTIIVINKIDITGEPTQILEQDAHTLIFLSAKTGAGLALLSQVLLKKIGYAPSTEGVFLARRRHLTLLQQTLDTIQAAKQQFIQHQAGELLAEDLRLAHDSLGEITGRVSSDDLLGEIFSQFCIGK